MALSKDFLDLLDAADADRPYISVHLALPGDREVTVNFVATASSTNGLRQVKHVLAAFNKDSSIDNILGMLEWLETMAATEEDLAKLKALDERGYLTPPELRKMVSVVMETVTGRPTGPSSSSATGSPVTGRTSTVPSPLPVPTFEPSPSTGS